MCVRTKELGMGYGNEIWTSMLVLIQIIVFSEIVTTTGSYFVSFDSAEERDGWIESIRKASVR